MDSSNMNMANMFGKITEMQEKMQEAQKELENIVEEAEAGGGMVKVKANGKRQLVSIDLDKEVVDPEDTEMLEDLIVAGANKALQKAEKAGQDHIQKQYKDMLPDDMKNMDLSQFGL